MIEADHPVFSNSVPHVPGLIGIPLVFHRVGTQSIHQFELDNQIVTYLNINAATGFAPPEWQSRVGTVIVARKVSNFRDYFLPLVASFMLEGEMLTPNVAGQEVAAASAS